MNNIRCFGLMLLMAVSVSMGSEVQVKSLDALIEADLRERTGDVRGLSDEKDITALVMAMQEKERQLQAALDEIARLKAWIEKIREASRLEKVTMHYNMGCMYKLYKQYDKAEAEFLKALSVAPNDPSIHYNLGILYDDDLKNKAAAKRHYERFLELSSDERDRATVQEWLSSL